MKTAVGLIVALAMVTAACGSSEREVGIAGQVRTPPPAVGQASLPNVTGGSVKVCFVSHTSGLGGAERSLLEVVRALGTLMEEAHQPNPNWQPR